MTTVPRRPEDGTEPEMRQGRLDYPRQTMIMENAGRGGHADILREFTDATIND